MAGVGAFACHRHRCPPVAPHQSNECLFSAGRGRAGPRAEAHGYSLDNPGQNRDHQTRFVQAVACSEEVFRERGCRYREITLTASVQRLEIITMVNRTRLSLLALVTAFIVHPGADAAEWLAEPSISLRQEYNDNFRLSSTDPDSVWGTKLDPRLRLSRRSDLWDLHANGRILAAWYAGDDDLNTVDNYVDLAAKRRF